MATMAEVPPTTIFPTFPAAELEREYQAYIHPQTASQAGSDKRLRVIGTIVFSVVVRMGWASKQRYSGAYDIVTTLLLLPLVAMLRDKPGHCDYLWGRIVVFWAACLCYNGLDAAAALEREPLLPPLLWQLLQTHVLTLLSMNLLLRLPFRVHISTHAAGLVVMFGSNAGRCRQVLAKGALPWVDALADFMRRATFVPVPAAESFAASAAGRCTVVAGFSQLMLGYLLPCFITLLLELRSRHAYLRQRRRWRQRQLTLQGGNPALVPQLGPWRPGRLLSWHLLWQFPLAAMLCWRWAEVATALFPST